MDLEIHVLWAWSETIAFAFSLDRSAPQVSRRQTLLKFTPWNAFNYSTGARRSFLPTPLARALFLDRSEILE